MTTTNLEITTQQISNLSLDKMKEIYRATYGVIPSGYHENNLNHYIILFERDLNNGRTLKHYSK